MSLSRYYLAQRLSFLQNEANSIIAGTTPVGTDSNLATVLTNGNSAGTQNIDLSNNDILQVDNINLTTINGLPFTPSTGLTAYTPIIESSGGAGAPTYALNIGQYTQIGKIVYFQMAMTLSGLGTLPAGTIQIPLPIGQNDGASASFTTTLWTGINAVTLPSWNSSEGSCAVGANFLTLSYRPAVGSATYSQLSVSTITSTFAFRMNGQYIRA